jgi:hypothetical protein
MEPREATNTTTINTLESTANAARIACVAIEDADQYNDKQGDHSGQQGAKNAHVDAVIDYAESA